MKIQVLEQLSDDELNQLGALLVKTVQSGASIGFLNRVSYDEAKHYWKSRALGLGQSILLLVAVVEQKIVGTVQLELSHKSNARHRAEVQKLMVAPEHRKQGIARKLLERLEQEAVLRRLHLLVLDTETNSPAEFLYRRLGWNHAGDIPNFALTPEGKLHSTSYYYKMLPAI